MAEIFFEDSSNFTDWFIFMASMKRQGEMLVSFLNVRIRVNLSMPKILHIGARLEKFWGNFSNLAAKRPEGV